MRRKLTLSVHVLCVYRVMQVFLVGMADRDTVPVAPKRSSREGSSSERSRSDMVDGFGENWRFVGSHKTC